MTPSQFFKAIQANLPQIKSKVLDVIEVEAENFVLENFQKGQFQDAVPRVWKARKVEDSPAYAPLVKSGDLKASATTARRSGDNVMFVMNQPYAQVHNEGLMSGRGSGFRMPKRQFIGNSEILNLRIQRKSTVAVSKFIKSL
jgi:phage gpG-like protein